MAPTAQASLLSPLVRASLLIPLASLLAAACRSPDRTDAPDCAPPRDSLYARADALTPQFVQQWPETLHVAGIPVRLAATMGRDEMPDPDDRCAPLDYAGDRGGAAAMLVYDSAAVPAARRPRLVGAVLVARDTAWRARLAWVLGTGGTRVDAAGSTAPLLIPWLAGTQHGERVVVAAQVRLASGQTVWLRAPAVQVQIVQ